MKAMKVLWILLCLAPTAGMKTIAQSEFAPGAIQLGLEKLRTLGSVLYIAAHPDDENSAVIAYMANRMKLRTGYLSLTRGDGGQNLIGSEQSELLGAIRTQELLAARRSDGGEQLFARAYDFGYSKSTQETFAVWNHDSILADVVWVIRSFRPDVILTRFPTTGEGGHGHHTASAILALEGFRAAADSTAFPDQLAHVSTWQARRIYWNAWPSLLKRRGAKLDEMIRINTGEFNPLLGMSYTEISSRSRTLHKSQGFGSAPAREDTWEYFYYLDGDSARSDLFERIDIGWPPSIGGEKITGLIDSLVANFDIRAPSSSIPALVRLYRLIEPWSMDQRVERKKQQIVDLIRLCAGLWLEAVADESAVVPGGSVRVSATVSPRSETTMTLRGVLWPGLTRDGMHNDTIRLDRPLRRGKGIRIDSIMHFSSTSDVTIPFWLRTKPDGRFVLPDQYHVGLADNPPAREITFWIEVAGMEIYIPVPVTYRWTHRVDGEKTRLLEVLPPVTLRFSEQTFVFADKNPREVRVTVQAHGPDQHGNILLKLPEGWVSHPNEISFDIAERGAEQTVRFRVTPPGHSTRGVALATIRVGDRTYTYAAQTIDHAHIPIQTILQPAQATLVRLDIRNSAARIAYFMGSGDDVPAYLRQIGCEVTLIDDEDMDPSSLSHFDAVVVGIRAFNTRPRLLKAVPALLNYVKSGGTMVVQYQVAWELDTVHIGPQPFKVSTKRVTDERSEVTMTHAKHPLLDRPNAIRSSDFDGWVQERGLYFASEVDSAYDQLLSMGDAGEEKLPGSLIGMRYGKGWYFYTGLAFFRQLPAGVSGAYRLFANLLSAGHP